MKSPVGFKLAMNCVWVCLVAGTVRTSFWLAISIDFSAASKLIIYFYPPDAFQARFSLLC